MKTRDLSMAAAALLLGVWLVAPSEVRACDFSPAAKAAAAEAISDYVGGEISVAELEALIDAIVGPGCYEILEDETIDEP